MHGPYYINLCSKEEEKIKKSLNHLIATARAGEWMRAYRLVFHPGFIQIESLKKQWKFLKIPLADYLKSWKLKVLKSLLLHRKPQGNVHNRENVSEIVELCASFDHFEPTIDFAHVHARGRGFLNKKRRL